MSDSTDNTKDLDSYGVWVKTPPQDASSDSETQETQIDADMPDFSDLDLPEQAADTTAAEDPFVSDDFNFDSLNTEETGISDSEASALEDTATAEEPAAETEEADTTETSEGAETAADEDPFGDIQDFGVDIQDFSSDIDFSEEQTETAGDIDIPVPQEESTSETEGESSGETEISADNFLSDSSESSGDDQEISLDDFMDGDFSDPNPGAPSASSSDDGEISLDDFFDDDSSSKAKEDDITNDEALDIDLSFTESQDDEVPTVDNTDDSDDSFSAESEEVSDFDDMFDNMEAAAGQTEETTPSGETESISMDEFGLTDEAPAKSTSDSSTSSDSEEIDLSDFGIDSEAEETAVHQDVQEAKKNQKVDYDLAISEDDTNEAAPTATEVESGAGQTEQIPENATVVDNSILEKIMSELSGLKSEINNLKFDFETLKSQESESEAESGTDAFVPVSETSDEVFEAHENQAETEFEENSSDVTEEEIPLPEIPEPETNGFFSGDDQDETIALSGNELDNIMNTADFTEVHEEPAAEEAENTEISSEEAEAPAEQEFPDIPEPETNGFFSGDDQDETIALSGNELDNIMNTADFTEVHEESAETEEVPVESSAYSETEETADTDSKEENPFEETPEITMEEFSPLEEKLSSDLEVSDEEVSSFEDETAEASDTPEAESFDTDFTDSTPFGDLAEGADDSEHSETDSGLSIDMNNESLEEPDLSSLETDGLESEITIPKVDDISESTEEGSSSILVESSGDDFMDSVSDSEQPEAPVFEETETASNELSEEAAPLFDESESLDSLLGSETEPEQPAENTENEIPSVTDFAELSEESPAEPVLEDTDSPAEEFAEESPAEEAAEIPESEEVQPTAETEIAGTVEADTDTFEELSLEDSSIDSFLAPEAEISDSLSEENVNYLNEGENFAESDAESMEETAAESETSKEAIPEKNEESVPAAATETDKPVSAELKNDIRSVLLYMDQLLENLPEDKIVEFAKSEQFTTYKRLFSELGLS